MRDQLEQLTAEHMDDPKVGDMFHEMYSFWVKVNGRMGDKVFTREGNSRLDSQWEGTVDEFKKRFAYGSIPGYSVSLYTKPATPPTTDTVLVSREEAAKVCESLVTFDPEHEKYTPADADVPCGWCDGLEKAAAKIRALPPYGKE